MRNSRLLFLVRLSFTTSTKYYDLCLLDTSNMLPLVRITPDFPPVEFSPTHCQPVDVDFSLTDFPPTSSEVVRPFSLDYVHIIKWSTQVSMVVSQYMSTVSLKIQRVWTMCAVVVSKTSCKDRNHRILRHHRTTPSFFFFAKIMIFLDF